jgi:hypothetical protein
VGVAGRGVWRHLAHTEFARVFLNEAAQGTERTTRRTSFSIFPSSQHIMETIDFVGQKHTKVLPEGFFDAANYTCGPTKLRTNFDLSEGGVWVHGFIATFTRL